MAKELLDSTSRMLQAAPEMVFYRWSGKVFSEAHNFIRLDKTYLNVLRMTKDGPRIQRIVGYLDSSDENNPKIVFSTKAVYRIMTGKRQGRILPPSKVKEDEKAVIAGICKKLTLDNTPGSLKLSNEADRYILDMLQDLKDQGSEFHEYVQCPVFYLCCAPANNVLIPRSSGKVFQYFVNLENFDPNDTLNSNLRKLKNQLQVDAGDNLVAYNYEYIYGKGVIAVDPQLNGLWFSTLKSHSILSDDHVSISMNNEE